MRSGAYALCFAAALPQLQAEARKAGYALAVHGSMATDLDLIAIPWTEQAWEAQKLVDLLCEVVNGRMYSDIDPNPVPRPHGRLAWSIYFNRDMRAGPYIDLSVMPRASAAPSVREQFERLQHQMTITESIVRAQDRDYKNLDAAYGMMLKKLEEAEKPKT